MVTRMRRDEGAMMILLGAILLVAAFLAMAMVLSRVGNTQDAVSRDLDDTLTQEAQSVAIGIRAIANAMTASTTYCADLADALDQIKSSVAARGFLMSYTVTTCTDASGPVTVQFLLTDGESELTQTVSTT